MITANFFHIKSTNGLFFYGLDYLRENAKLLRVVLIREELKVHLLGLLPNVPVISCSLLRYPLELMLACRRGDLIFTPTSHPIPFIDHQWVVFHDAYPFVYGLKGALKRFLLRFSLSLSRCMVGYINRSECLPYLCNMRVAPDRLVFSPNRFTNPKINISRITNNQGGLVVGLVGTDSDKKNYDKLFLSIQKNNLSKSIRFRIFGHNSSYLEKIYSNFPDFKIELVKSDTASICEFLSAVDVLVSVADYEGFGRIFAFALFAGVPVDLIDKPVFREFFDGGAHFHSSVDNLVASLARHRGDRLLDHVYSPPANIIFGYTFANKEINRLGSLPIKKGL